MEYSSELEKTIDCYEKNRTQIRDTWGYTDTDSSRFQAEGMKVLSFMVCLKPESSAYGRGVGTFAYKDGHLYQFRWNIHTPRSKGPHKSNQMTDIHRVMLDLGYDGVTARIADTDFGSEAFQTGISKENLGPEARSLRELMASVRRYCTEKDLCRKLRRLDRKHLEWRAARQNELIASNSTYGITKEREVFHASEMGDKTEE